MKEHQLSPICEKPIADPSTLVLYLRWHPSRADALGVTLSDGRVCLCESTPNSDNALWSEDAAVRMSDVHNHSLEAWILAFNHHALSDAPQILSGGDDIVLQCSHTPTSDDTAQLLWQDRKLHQAGVTAILPLSESLILTGSYDDHIRLLSCPSVGRRKCLAELDLGGGVWRLQVLLQERGRDGDELSSSTDLVLPADADADAATSSGFSRLVPTCAKFLITQALSLLHIHSFTIMHHQCTCVHHAGCRLLVPSALHFPASALHDIPNQPTSPYHVLTHPRAYLPTSH